MTEKAPKSNLPSNLIINEKQVVDGIVKAYNTMETSKKEYVCSVIRLGEKLNSAKNSLPHGHWIDWIKGTDQFRFDARQASKYMLVSANKTLVLEYFRTEESLNQLTKSISEATPEQLEKAKQLEAEQQAKAEAVKAAKAIPAPKPAPEIIEGEFTEVKPEIKPAPVVQPEPDDEDHTDDLLKEYESIVKHLTKDNDRLEKILSDDDQLAAALLELKKVNSAYRVLEELLAGVQNQLNSNIKLASYWKRKYDKLVKAQEAA